jgi:dihydrofolate reductase
MHVTLATVASLDGRLTRGEDPNVHAWSSVEDWHHFVELRNNSQVLVMDREAYEQIKPEPEKDLLRVVMTHHPETPVLRTIFCRTSWLTIYM